MQFGHQSSLITERLPKIIKLNPSTKMSNTRERAATKTTQASLSNHEISKALIDIYSNLNPLYGLYVRLRLILAPLIETALYVPPEGDILDLGCGNGIFAHLVRLHYPGRKILGIDKNETR